MTDRGVDLFLAFVEAIYWRQRDAGELLPGCSPDAVFRQRGYWARKNPKDRTSRDRFRQDGIAAEITALEQSLAVLGYGAGYCAGIRSKATGGISDYHALYLYKTALARTLSAKQRRPGPIQHGAGQGSDTRFLREKSAG